MRSQGQIYQEVPN
ncbi:UNVERIFIED_CONTAM: hypothetical protein GTU68_029671 [Idotea baltica]|nr:hypothetical protein [Idotea baltica]